MTCSCGNGKPIHANKRCRSCYEKFLKARNPEYAERQRRNAAAWAAKYPDRIAAYKAKRAAKEAADPAFKERRRYRRIKKVYGLDKAQAEKLLAGGCAICGGFDRLRIDHDHSNGMVRGCLCHYCNIGLGFIERPDSWLDRALGYLQKTGRSHENKCTRLRLCGNDRIVGQR